MFGCCCSEAVAGGAKEMSYERIMRDGVPFYLCWNCGRIHIEEKETQHEYVDYKFIERVLDKHKRFEKTKKEVEKDG